MLCHHILICIIVLCYCIKKESCLRISGIGARNVYHTLHLVIQNPVEKQPSSSRIPKNVKTMKINPNWMVTHTSLLKVSIQTNKLKAKSICVNLKSLSVKNTKKIYHKVTLSQSFLKVKSTQYKKLAPNALRFTY